MVALLGALELSALRGATESAMPGSVVIYRRTLVSDGAGGQTAGTLGPQPVGTVIARAVPRRGEPTVMVAGGRVEARGDWYVYVPVGTEVNRQTDHLVHSSGGTFDVLFTNVNRAYPVEIRLTCMERR